MMVLFAVYWLLVLGTLLYKKGYNSIMGLGVLLIIAALMVFNSNNPDYRTYEAIYTSINDTTGLDHGNDYLYLLTNRIGYYLGLSFKEYRCIFISTCLLSFYCFINKHTKNVSLCLFFYLLTGGILDYIQLRQFGAMAIAIWIVDIAMNQQVEKKFFKMMVLILLAAGFHKSSLLYLIMAPYFFVNRNHLKRIYGISFLVLVGVITLGLRSSIVYSLMKQFAGEGTASYYLVSRHYVDEVPKIVFDILVQQVLLIVIVLIQYRKADKGGVSNERLLSVLAIDVLITALMPLNILSIQFKRLARITLIPSFSEAFSDNMNIKTGVVRASDLLIVSLLMIYSFLYMSITLSANPSILSDLFTVFTNNNL